MRIHKIEHWATENILGIPSARGLREEPKNSPKIANLCAILALQPHWLAGFTEPLPLASRGIKRKKLAIFMLNSL